MAREITIDWACEWPECAVRAPEGSDEVIERTITVDRLKPKTAMFCKQHNEDFDEFIMPILHRATPIDAPTPTKRSKSSSGTGTTRAAQEGDEIVCREEQCERHGRPLRNRTGMAQHVIRSHGYESLAAYEAVHGMT